MDDSSWISIVAAAIALFSLMFTATSARATKRQADEARHQTDLQRQIRFDSARPYVWADIFPDAAQGMLLKLTVCNEGPTVATNIKVQFTPELDEVFRGRLAGDVQLAIKSGISYLAPNRRVQWVVDNGPQFFEKESVTTFSVSITCDGPDGPNPLSQFQVDLEYLRHSHDSPEGSLHRVAEGIKDLAASLNAMRSGHC